MSSCPKNRNKKRRNSGGDILSKAKDLAPRGSVGGTWQFLPLGWGLGASGRGFTSLLFRGDYPHGVDLVSLDENFSFTLAKGRKNHGLADLRQVQ